jgi:hypothetical protein
VDNAFGVCGLSRRRATLNFVLACCAIFLIGGCKNTAQVFEDNNDGGWFSKKVDIFAKPDWARPSTAQVSLGPRGPVAAEDLVGSDGQCAPPPATQASEAAPAQPAEPAEREVGSVAGDLAGAPMPAATRASAPPDRLEMATTPPAVAGGIGLGMTECQAVQRAGVPNNVAISAGDKGERKAVLTFLSGPWPGIYTFADGRLKVIERAPEQPKQAGAPAKKTPKKKSNAPRTANQDFQRSYVQ